MSHIEDSDALHMAVVEQQGADLYGYRCVFCPFESEPMRESEARFFARLHELPPVRRIA